MTGSNGIDVSNNNGAIKLTQGFSGLDFVIAKATQGLTFTDRTLPWYHSQAKAAGVLFGAYHFGTPGASNGIGEAARFLDALAAIGGPQSGWSLWYDYEAPEAGWRFTPDNDAGVILDFISTIKHHTPPAKVGIYSNLDGFGRILPIMTARGLRTYDALWLAEPNNQLETPDAPLARYGASWTIHQYETFHGVDRDYCRLSQDDLLKLFSW